MKKTFVIMGSIALCLLTLSASAQQTDPLPPQPVKTWDAKTNPTVDSITSKYKDKMVSTRPALTTADIFPVLGEFESASNADAAHIIVSQDEQNKGVIWIAGLPQGKLKAMLRKSPATYKIPSQKNEEGKDIQEGTLIFDKETNNLSILIGKEFNAADPASAFVPVTEPIEEVKVKSKTAKTKIKKEKKPQTWTYTGTKMVKETVMN
ncbi:MAG: hypothetical protein SGI83_18690 [Bacteroidota bacterium]|nr:hypothetical protein [Bacteroidota bacterium]